MPSWEERIENEFQLNRELQHQQFELTQTLVSRNTEAFVGLMATLKDFRAGIGEFRDRLDQLGHRLDQFGDRIDQFGGRIDQFGDRIDQFGDRIDAFGATLDLQREILLRFLDRLDEEQPPPQG